MSFAIQVFLSFDIHYDEEAAYTEKTEYLLGRDILAAPVLKKGALSRSVYLPEDSWTHMFTGREYGGGTHLVEAPIGLPPVFIRTDSARFAELMKAVRTAGGWRN